MVKKRQKGVLYGYKDLLMENFNIILAVLFVAFMVGLMGLMAQVSDNNKFAEEAGNIISKHGGITEKAQVEISQYSNEVYNNRYRILSENTEAFDYGEPIAFAIEAKARFFFLDIPLELKYESQTVSKTRISP